MSTRWGIAGCGKISSDFLTSWRALPKENHLLVAVAARSLDRAEEYANRFGGQKAYGSYQELAADAGVEIVYVGVVNSMHLEVVKMMLEAGKNVLCEKTMGMNLKDTQLMVDLAREKKLFLMEAIWSRCFSVYKEVEKRIQSKEIGDIEVINVTFGHSFPLNSTLGGRATLDLGVYCLQFVLFVLHGEIPTKIIANGFVNKEGADESASVTMCFASGAIANVIYSNRLYLTNEAIVAGPKGTIKIPNFWAPESLTSPSGNFVSELPSIEGSKYHFVNSQGLMYEAEEVRRCLKEGYLECPLYPLEESLKIATIMESIFDQLGVNH